MASGLLKGKKLQKRELVLLVITLLVIVGMGYYLLEYEVQEEKIKTAQMELDELEKSISIYQQAVSTPAEIQKAKLQIGITEKRIEDLKSTIKEIKSRMKGQDIEILRRLKQEADVHGAILRSFQTVEKEETQGTMNFKRVTVDLTIHSDYQALIHFLNGLNSIPAIVNLTKMRTERVDEILPNIETEMRLNLYVL